MMASETPIPSSAASDNGGCIQVPFPAADSLTSVFGLQASDFTNGTNSYFKIPFLNSKAVVIDEVIVNMATTLPGTAQYMQLVSNGVAANGAKTAPSGAPTSDQIVTEQLDLNTLTVGVGANIPIHPTGGGPNRNNNVLLPFSDLFLYFPAAPTTFKGLSVAIRFREYR